MKKIASIVIVIAVLLIIGKIIVAGEVSDLEKDIVESVKKGGYYTALEDAKDIEFQGKKLSRKTAKLIEDVKLYGAAQEETEKGEYAEMNLGKIKAILDEMNGSYKKYDKFKSDIEEFKEKVDSLEEYGNLGVELVGDVEALIAEGEINPHGIYHNHSLQPLRRPLSTAVKALRSGEQHREPNILRKC